MIDAIGATFGAVVGFFVRLWSDLRAAFRQTVHLFSQLSHACGSPLGALVVLAAVVAVAIVIARRVKA